MPAPHAKAPVRGRLLAGALLLIIAGAAWWAWQSTESAQDSTASATTTALDAAAMANSPAPQAQMPAVAPRKSTSNDVTVTTQPANTTPTTQASPSGSSAAASAAAPRGLDATLERMGASDAEEEEEPRMPLHWHPCGPGRNAGVDEYRFASDRRTSAKESHSASISNRVQRPALAFAGFCQHVSAQPYRGRRVAFSAFLRTDKAVPGAQLRIRAEALDGRVVALASTFERRIPGTTPWVRQTIVIDIPEDAAAIMVGAALQFIGTLWIDEATLEVVDESWPITDKVGPTGDFVAAPLGRDLPPRILNPGFEETVPLK